MTHVTPAGFADPDFAGGDLDSACSEDIIVNNFGKQEYPFANFIFILTSCPEA